MPETEDQLTPDERIRLEALNQATQSFPGRAPGTVVAVAQQYELYIRNGEDNPAEFEARIHGERTKDAEER